MGLIPSNEVYKLIKKGEIIIEPYDQKEENAPPATIDLTIAGKRIGYCFKDNEYVLGKEIEDTEKNVKEVQNGTVTLSPGEGALFQLYEKIVLPCYIAGLIVPRSSITRLGISFQSTYINPGYQGYCPVLLVNHSPFIIRIPFKNGRGPRVAQIMFFNLLDKPHRVYGEGIDEKYQYDEGYHSMIYKDVDIKELLKPLVEVVRKYEE